METQDGRGGPIPTHARFIGIDVGSESVKIVELVRENGGLTWRRRDHAEHGKEPATHLRRMLATVGWERVDGAAVTGRGAPQIALPSVPVKHAQGEGCRFLLGNRPVTVVSIGGHGFSVQELRPDGNDTYRTNARCSQGTGNFLRQLCGRFGLSVAEAGQLARDVSRPAALSGRCPVILKTDMTHLANKGHDRREILAGLFDAVCENVLPLVRPGDGGAGAVVLIGGVARSERVRQAFAAAVERQGVAFLATDADDGLYFEALGAALHAAAQCGKPPSLEALFQPPRPQTFEQLPPLAASMGLVRRMACAPDERVNGHGHDVVLGFDIGSTGSKLVAIDAHDAAIIWEGYRRTGGRPVEAAQGLLQQFGAETLGRHRPVLFGATGSGREIVGSLMTTCYGRDAVYILNEIAAHAAGALHFDREVDTIFEIGGQDAKYIRLAGGRIVDCAMNEACSAGTGSFIEEQGCKFADIGDVAQLGREALAAPHGISLGQHCSVFMAEIIEEAVSAGVDRRAIIAGLYDSIIQNYLHRVKGNRSVGAVIFCQGMPFASDALAAAVARQTGSRVIVPPNPGTVGALGIALLARRDLMRDDLATLAPQRFLGAAIESRGTFVCNATAGCGGGGNKCRIDRIQTVVEGRRQTFTWGGGCALHDKGTRRKKLPDRAPDPFHARAALVREVIAACADRPGRPRIAITDEFALSGLFPFFATFLHGCGLDLQVVTGADHTVLKRGIREAAVPFCAPMQLYHGVIRAALEAKPDFVFLPMLREVPKAGTEPDGVTCPIVQGSADLLLHGLPAGGVSKIVSPVINMGDGGLDSDAFLAACRGIAAEIGAPEKVWRLAFAAARAAQQRFDDRCLALGRDALAFCAEMDVLPVVVLGRTYTIHNAALNSNVPAILREQGALAIPMDCYPVADGVPVFDEVFWGYGQRILRAAHQIRRTPGVSSIYCSNYACGPDSFALHFYAHVMAGRPFAVIETDGHAGDAGTKTRIEAFLHCVGQDRAAGGGHGMRNELRAVTGEDVAPHDLRAGDARVLIPGMGFGTDVLVACLRGGGIRAEALPPPDREALQLGRRHTSGKECLPACLTLGSLLQRLQRAGPRERFIFLMPKSNGPCRLGVYHVLDRIVLDRLGLRDRVRVWSPSDADYFADLPASFPALMLMGLRTAELIAQALQDVAADPQRWDAARGVYRRRMAGLLALIERTAGDRPSLVQALAQVATGGMFGLRAFAAAAAREFGALRNRHDGPTVLLTGEIYVRCDPFANDFVAERLARRGIRVKLTPFTEWFEYVNRLNRRSGRPDVLSAALRVRIQQRVARVLHDAMAPAMCWEDGVATADDALAAARTYLRDDLEGEAALTVGASMHEWRHGRVDGVINVCPLECMPGKISEAHFVHAAQREGLLALTLPLNGDPVDSAALDNFIFEVRSRRRRGHTPAEPGVPVA